MGTHCTTRVYDADGFGVVSMVRTVDGHPRTHGVELARFLNTRVLVNGFTSIPAAKIEVNGLLDLAAQMVEHFKVKLPRDIFLEPLAYEEHIYVYEVHKDRYRVRAGGRAPEIIYDGPWSEWRLPMART